LIKAEIMSRRRKREERREGSSTATSGAEDANSLLNVVSDGSSITEQTDRLRPWLLAGATALFVARPLVLSDGGPWLGDGEPFAALWLVLVLLWTLGALGRPRLAIRFGWIDASSWHSCGRSPCARTSRFSSIVQYAVDGGHGGVFPLRQLALVGREGGPCG
jgi:hypothetical protein